MFTSAQQTNCLLYGFGIYFVWLAAYFLIIDRLLRILFGKIYKTKIALTVTGIPRMPSWETSEPLHGGKRVIFVGLQLVIFFVALIVGAGVSFLAAYFLVAS